MFFVRFHMNRVSVFPVMTDGETTSPLGYFAAYACWMVAERVFHWGADVGEIGAGSSSLDWS